MDCQIHLIIYKKSSIYDKLILTLHDVIQYNKESNGNNTFYDGLPKLSKSIPLRLNKKGFNSYSVSAYVSNLRRSNLFRKSAMQMLIIFAKKRTENENWKILIKLQCPKKQFLDYAWNKWITQLLLERREIEHAMSWLSTLGGAFSALGEKVPYYAEVAGKISLKQFKLAYRLGDPFLVERCKLYAALSLIQRGYIRRPKHMIENIYKFAVKEKDLRLQNMCQGVWVKLKYLHKRRKQKNKKVS